MNDKEIEKRRVKKKKTFNNENELLRGDLIVSSP